MACLGSKSSIDLTEPSVFLRSTDPAGASQLSDFLNVGDCSERPGRLGEKAERLVFVVFTGGATASPVSGLSESHHLD